MCKENSGEDSIDTVTEEVIATRPLKQKEAEDKFPCHLCDFESNRPNGLVIHMGRKHKKNTSSNIGQFDGNATIATNVTNDIDDELFKRTEHYWKNGWLGISDRDFVDAPNIIDESDLDEEDKKCEKDALAFVLGKTPLWREGTLLSSIFPVVIFPFNHVFTYFYVLNLQ